MTMTMKSKFLHTSSRISQSARLFAGALTVATLMIGGCHSSADPWGKRKFPFLPFRPPM